MDNQAKWLEISLIVNGELAEAISDILSRHLPNGVVIEKAVEYDTNGEGYSASGQARVCGYLPMDEDVEVKKCKLEESLWHLHAIQPLPEIRYQVIPDQNWMEKWKERYHPILVGERLLILPPWLENPEPDRIPIRIDPNMAFGTGTHPTTQLCLGLMEKHLQEGDNLIDIGCGSGILSIGGRLLGASHALAVDIDPLSVQATKDNAVLNDVTTGLEVGLGSVAEAVQNGYSIRQAEIVLANILAPTIMRLFADGLANLLTPGGTLILSGILEPQERDILKAGTERGLIPSEKMQIDDWVAVSLKKSST